MRFKRTLYSTMGCFVFSLFYLLFVYSLASGSLGNAGDIFNKSPTGGAMVEIGVGDQVDVQVVRNRWYGTIVESHTQNGIMSELYLLDLVGIPMNVGEFELFYVHLSILLIIIFVIALFFMIDLFERRSDTE